MGEIKSIEVLDDTGALKSITGTTTGSSTAMDTNVTGGVGGSSGTYTTATKSNVTAAASNTLILASNTSRLEAIITNDADETLLLSYGTTAASATSFTIKIPTDGSHIIDGPLFTGELRGIWEGSPTGAARVTEGTA